MDWYTRSGCNSIYCSCQWKGRHFQWNIRNELPFHYNQVQVTTKENSFWLNLIMPSSTHIRENLSAQSCVASSQLGSHSDWYHMSECQWEPCRMFLMQELIQEMPSLVVLSGEQLCPSPASLGDRLALSESSTSIAFVGSQYIAYAEAKCYQRLWKKANSLAIMLHCPADRGKLTRPARWPKHIWPMRLDTFNYALLGSDQGCVHVD